MNANDIIIRPVITEKSIIAVGNDKFTFIVAKQANKDEIRAVIEKQFNVHVVSIATSIQKGRSARAGIRRIETKKSAIKKAIVQLKKGEKIDLFETGV